MNWNDIAKIAIENAAIVGVSYLKMTVDPKTNEIEFELLNPFKGCECGDPN